MCALGTRPDSDGEQAWLEGGEGVVAGSVRILSHLIAGPGDYKLGKLPNGLTLHQDPLRLLL